MTRIQDNKQKLTESELETWLAGFVDGLIFMTHYGYSPAYTERTIEKLVAAGRKLRDDAD